MVETHRWLTRARASTHAALGRRVGMDIDDLASIATFGLIDAVKYFKPELARSFEGWAIMLIDRRIRAYCRTRIGNGLFRIPRSTSPSDRAGLYEQFQIRCLEECKNKPAVDNYKEVEQLLEALPSSHAAVLRLVYLDGYSVNAVANKLGLSVRQVTEIEQQALDMARDITD